LTRPFPSLKKKYKEKEIVIDGGAHYFGQQKRLPKGWVEIG